jgi:hypothetical protein
VKIELPKLEFTQAKEETKQSDENNKHHSISQTLGTKYLFIYMATRPIR